FKRIGAIAKSVGAIHVADISHIAGLIVAKQHPSPFPYADVVMMTTHKTMRGPRGAIILSKGQELAEKIDKAIMPGLQGGPHNNQTAGIARMLELIQEPSFTRYVSQVIKNAKTLSTELKRYGFNLVSGGTDNHLLLIDLKNKSLSGAQAEKLLESAGIIANRNSVPGDDKPFNPTGIRMGTPALTSRGMKEKEMKSVARFIHHLVDLKEPAEFTNKEVKELTNRFPLPYK
ncbi:MAG: serine hydroxymethyltransferase, partial [Candidatus Harrisonbacteria bacterium CG10_big_fil_rev_8_21_14_0_10_45_28]